MRKRAMQFTNLGALDAQLDGDVRCERTKPHKYLFARVVDDDWVAWEGRNQLGREMKKKKYFI